MRIRFRFTKLGKVRFTSHRDVARMWERAFRRVELPLAYTAGFSPRPKVSFGLALPTGHESLAEYLDADLDPERVGSGFDPSTLPDALSAALPVGVDVTAAATIDDRALSLQQEVISCQWDVTVSGADHDDLSQLVVEALASPALVITREKKGQDVTDDVRPAILDVAVEDGTVLNARLAAQPRSIRPSELLAALSVLPGAPHLTEVLARRTHQWLAEPPAEPLVASMNSERSTDVRLAERRGPEPRGAAVTTSALALAERGTWP